MQLIQSLKPVAAALFGAGLASIAAAAPPGQPPSFGPALIILFGYEVPLLPAICGMLGVIATRRFAPPAAIEARIDQRGRWALTAMMVLGILGLVLSGERRPLVIVGLAGGLGYSGVAVFELLAAGVRAAVRIAIDAFTRGAISIAQERASKRDDQP